MVYIEKRRLKEIKRIRQIQIRQIQSRQIKETKQVNGAMLSVMTLLFFCLDAALGTLWGRRKKKEKEYADTLILSLSWATGRLLHPVEKNCAGISWQQPVLPESSSHLHTCTLLHGGSVRGRQQCRCWQSDQLLPYLARS